MTISDCRKAIENCKSQIENRKSKILNPLVFFLNDKQQKIVERALLLAGKGGSDFGGLSRAGTTITKAAKNAAALTYIAQQFLSSKLEIKPGNNY